MPTHVVSAPGRTEIIGNHTDHNHGRVVAAAVTLDALAVAAPAAGGHSRLRSTAYDSVFVASREGHDTGRLMGGVAEGLASRGLPARAYDAVLDSTVPPGSGLSSSAALVVCLAGIHGALAGSPTPPLEAALAGQYAENNFMGKPSGLMDQLASANGGLVTIDFAEAKRPEVGDLPLRLADRGYMLAVVATGGSHADLTDHYAAIPAEMKRIASLLGAEVLAEVDAAGLIADAPRLRAAAGDRAWLRALHFVDEQARVDAFVRAARDHDLGASLAIMRESGLSSWRLLQNVTVPGSTTDQATAVALAAGERLFREAGVDAAVRIHGGGFAGTILAAFPADLEHALRETMERLFGAGCLTPLTIRSQGLADAALSAPLA